MYIMHYYTDCYGYDLKSAEKLFTRMIPETACKMIVDHAGGLHKGVTDCAADKFESLLAQGFAHRV